MKRLLLSLMAIAIPLTEADGQVPSVEQLRNEVLVEVTGMARLSQQIVDMVFSFAELGFQEFWTVEYITRLLADEGFEVTTGCAGMPTCFVATWGAGSPVIGFMGDIDGLPEVSQKPGVAFHDPLIAGGPGHGEGHNSASAVDVVAAIATKRVMDRHRLVGTLKVIPGVAEELVASRTYMVNAGLFDSLDVMLSNHVSPTFGTGWGTSGTGLVSTQYTFLGRSAHAANSPAEGRSALDAVELMNTGWNYRREHLRPQHRSHYVITEGGNQPNVVPSRASVWYYFRERDYERIRDLHAVGSRVAEGAAMMTGTRVEERVFGATWPWHYNKPLAQIQHANIARVGYPEWTASDQTLARAVQGALGRAETGLHTRIPGGPSELRPGSGGSDDIAEVSWNVPTVRLSYPSQIPGVIYHHWSAGIAMATPIAHKGANHGARVTAMTAIDLVAQPEHVADAWEYFRSVQTAGIQWQSLIPEGTAPPIHLNAEQMERFRPRLRELRYDPDRYTTYMEQLEIAYPTLTSSDDGPARHPSGGS